MNIFFQNLLLAFILAATAYTLKSGILCSTLQICNTPGIFLFYTIIPLSDGLIQGEYGHQIFGLS